MELGLREKEPLAVRRQDPRHLQPLGPEDQPSPALTSCHQVIAQGGRGSQAEGSALSCLRSRRAKLPSTCFAVADVFSSKTTWSVMQMGTNPCNALLRHCEMVLRDSVVQLHWSQGSCLCRGATVAPGLPGRSCLLLVSAGCWHGHVAHG